MTGADESRLKRKHVRTPLSILVQYRFSTFEDWEYEYTTDLSPGGVFLRTANPRELGSGIYLQFSPRDGSRLIEGMGKVVRVTPAAQKGAAGGMGVEFTDFDEPSLAFVRALCEQHERGSQRLLTKQR